MTPFNWGAEFLVNTSTFSDQYVPNVVGLADGRFVIAWNDQSLAPGDTSGKAVRAQFFAADGHREGGEFVIPTTVADSQSSVDLAALDTGGFFATWEDNSQTGDDTDTYAVRGIEWGALGPVGTEEVIDSTTTSWQHDPAVAALPQGGVVVVWTDESLSSDDPSNSAVRGRVFDIDGNAISPEFLINTTTTDDQEKADVAALDDGRFVVTWSDSSQSGGDTSSTAVRGQVFSPDGLKSGAEFLVNTVTLDAQDNARVTGLQGGRFVVTWEDYSQIAGDPSNWGVFAQVYESDGTTLGDYFMVNTATTSTQSDPAICALSDGGFVITWNDYSGAFGDSSLYAVVGQAFHPDGTKNGSDFRINTITTGNQFAASVEALADGRFVVAWQDGSMTGNDTSGNAIRAQIFDPRAAGTRLEGTELGDDYVGTRWGDRIFGDEGHDTLRGEAGDDRIEGETGDDHLYGGWGRDRLLGEAGDDYLHGGMGRDRLVGGDGADLLDGGMGIDRMVGNAGNDTYVVDRTSDQVIELEGGGKDTVMSASLSLNLADYARVEYATLLGDAGLNLTGTGKANVLTGNDSANVLEGGGGRDQIDGGADTDVLRGDRGRDTLTGGAGFDVFWFLALSDSGPKAKQRDRITDFEQGTDLIDLSTIDARAGGGNQAFTFIGNAGFSGAKGELRYTQTATKTLLRADTDGDQIADMSIELDGLIALTTGDFIL